MKETSSSGVERYQRIISTSVASDTMLVDLLSPHQLYRIVGLSNGFQGYGLDQTQEALLNYSLAQIFTMEAMETIFSISQTLLLQVAGRLLMIVKNY